MRSYLIPIVLALLLLIGCGGEGYVSVWNDTTDDILVSVNHNTDVVVNPGDTSDTYTVSVMKGVVNNVSVEATGEWVGNYSGTAAVTNGASVVHRISPQVADITLANLSVDSASCTVENYDPLYFTGNDEITDKFSVDGDVDVVYGGHYMFDVEETMAWMPGYTYRYELVPNACEIQLHNLHPTWTIYYVYLSRSTDQTWGDDQLGDDVLEPGTGYIWKAEGDVQWDMRVEAGDPHPDSVLYVYEFYDNDGCASDYTWIYEFPAIFSPASVAKLAKADGPNNGVMKPASLAKNWDNSIMPARIEKIKKVDAGKAGLKALTK
jgi:hypothetical protein